MTRRLELWMLGGPALGNDLQDSRGQNSRSTFLGVNAPRAPLQSWLYSQHDDPVFRKNSQERRHLRPQSEQKLTSVQTIDYRCEERRKYWRVKRRNRCRWTAGVQFLFQKITIITQNKIGQERHLKIPLIRNCLGVTRRCILFDAAAPSAPNFGTCDCHSELAARGSSNFWHAKRLWNSASRPGRMRLVVVSFLFDFSYLECLVE